MAINEIQSGTSLKQWLLNERTGDMNQGVPVIRGNDGVLLVIGARKDKRGYIG